MLSNLSLSRPLFSLHPPLHCTPSHTLLCLYPFSAVICKSLAAREKKWQTFSHGFSCRAFPKKDRTKKVKCETGCNFQKNTKKIVFLFAFKGDRKLSQFFPFQKNNFLVDIPPGFLLLLLFKYIVNNLYL